MAIQRIQRNTKPAAKIFFDRSRKPDGFTGYQEPGGFEKKLREWVGEWLARQDRRRQPRWTESIAVGSEAFVEKTKEELGTRGIGREISEENGVYELRERGIPYTVNFTGKNSDLRPKNTYSWNISG